MRPYCLASPSHLSILIFLLFALAVFSAPSPHQQHSTLQLPRSPIPLSNRVDIRKRADLRRHTIANGWVIHYKVISVIYPVLSSLMELRTLYTEVLTEVTSRSSAGELTGPFERFQFGKVILEFRAERGYSSSVGWDIITAFAEQLLQAQLPMTFECHIAPPESDVGIEVKLGVLI